MAGRCNRLDGPGTLWLYGVALVIAAVYPARLSICRCRSGGPSGRGFRFGLKSAPPGRIRQDRLLGLLA